MDELTFIIFDCKNPKYLFPTNKINKPELRDLPNNLTALIKNVAHCDKEDEIWLLEKSSEEKKGIYLAYEYLKSSYRYIHTSNFVSILKEKNNCDEFMKFILHPSYFVDIKTFKGKVFDKPLECTGKDDPKKSFTKSYLKTNETTTRKSSSKLNSSSTKKRDIILNIFKKKKKI